MRDAERGRTLDDDALLLAELHNRLLLQERVHLDLRTGEESVSELRGVGREGEGRTWLTSGISSPASLISSRCLTP